MAQPVTVWQLLAGLSGRPGHGTGCPDAELLVDALDDGLAGRCALALAMAGYEQRRNEATVPEYQQNLQMAQLQPPPAEASQLRAALRGGREATNRFYLTNEGMIPRETFFNPESLQRLMATGMVGAR